MKIMFDLESKYTLQDLLNRFLDYGVTTGFEFIVYITEKK